MEQIKETRAEPRICTPMATRRRASVGVQIGHSVAPTIRHATCCRHVTGDIRLCGPRDLGEIVSPITGVRRAEPVPDAFVPTGEITLIDLAPSALRHRLAQGYRGRSPECLRAARSPSPILLDHPI